MNSEKSKVDNIVRGFNKIKLILDGNNVLL